MPLTSIESAFYNVEIVKYLLLLDQCYMYLNAVMCGGGTALRSACVSGSVSCIHELVAHGACIETKDSDGDTALHQAALSNHPDCVKVLIEDYSASINTTNKKGQTPLYVKTA